MRSDRQIASIRLDEEWLRNCRQPDPAEGAEWTIAERSSYEAVGCKGLTIYMLIIDSYIYDAPCHRMGPRGGWYIHTWYLCYLLTTFNATAMAGYMII